MSRPAKAIINLDALQHNYQIAKSYTDHSQKVLAVIKANAYGHGAVACAKSLKNADGFAVSCLEEAIELRNAGIKQRILLLEGFFAQQELATIVLQQLDIVIHHEHQLQILESTKIHQPINVWLKMDSGMHRIGFAPEKYVQAWQRLKQISGIQNIILMTHLACADNPNNGYNAHQIQIFEQYTKKLPGQRSIANSGGLIGCHSARSCWNRAGIMLYGISPFLHPHKIEQSLTPIMTLQTEIISIRSLSAQQPVGYGGKWIASKNIKQGIIAIGYADGYPYTNESTVLIQNHRVPIIGQVSMDMLSIDLSYIPNTKIGDPVILWGEHLKVSDVAYQINTSPYNLLSNISRVKFEYKHQNDHLISNYSKQNNINN